ncbi:hypothetical protein M3Y94_00829300 [Aphelenchoides besseyi]|nr:hypothetical protein M3Y94_00829300 [Aphelenchoides besseyi]
MRLVFLLATIWAYLAIAEETPASPAKQQYAIISVQMLRGTKNVRWETRAISTMQDGKPIKTKGADGCTDMQGQKHGNNEEYKRSNHNHFTYKCVDGAEEVAACIGSNRTKNARIEVGQNLEVDGFWVIRRHECKADLNYSTNVNHLKMDRSFILKVIKRNVLVQRLSFVENSCRDFSGKEIHIGDEISAMNLRFACADGSYKVVGCAYKGENGQEQKLNEGEERQEGKLTHVCEGKDGNVQYSSKGQGGCSKNGKDYKEGDKFQENHLKYECKNGIVDITGCYVKEGQDLEIGKDVAEEGTLHRCYRLGAKIEYSESPCAGESCTNPPPIPDTPDEVPALGRGLKSPGVASFSIVSNGDPPKAIKLNLDKLMMGQK